MGNRRLLVLNQPGYSLTVPLPEAFRKYAPALSADQAEPTAETLDQLAQRGYDAVVCCADRPEELELVVRIRKSNARIPIVLLSSKVDVDFRAAAIERGASAVLPTTRNAATMVDLIDQAVQLRLAARETRQMAAEGKELSKEIRQLSQQTRTLTEESRRRLDFPYRPSLLPLLVCDNTEQAFQMVRALDKAEVFSPLPILRTTDEAIAYLSGRPPYDNRNRYPLPSLVMLDFQADGASGLTILSWIRQTAGLRHLPVIMLSAAVNAEDIRKAYGVQANSYLIKPEGFEELVDMVKAINLYWASLNVQPDR